MNIDGHEKDVANVEVSPNFDDLFLTFRGSDRPSLIAAVTDALDKQGLYIASMAFNLSNRVQNPDKPNPYSLEVHAKGSPDRIKEACTAAAAGQLTPPLSESQDARQIVGWNQAPHCHLSLFTPDAPGIVAHVSEIVGRNRGGETGNFIHLTAATLNDGGPQGGTPYFQVRANIAGTQESVIDSISEELERYGENLGTACQLHVTRLP